MANKIIFGDDLIDVLENKYNMNKLGEVPIKYKNGIITIDFIYGKEKDIDDLKYNKPYIEFTVDDETDGFISGTMYLNGGVEGIQFDSWEDLKYFMKNAKWTESKKSAKSLKEGIDVKIVYADDTPSEYIDDVTHNDILDIIEESPEVYKIFDVSGSKKKLVWSDEYGFERAYESKKSARKSMKESKASLHEDNIEYGVERIRNKVKGSDVTYYFDDEDCFIDVTEKNGNLWAFTIDFGSGYVYMLEPKEDRGSFGTDNEAFDVIVSMLQGKRFNEKNSMKEQFVGKGEGGYRKPRANKNNSGICEDSNGVNHKVIFDTHVEDFIVWVDDDNYLIWDIYSAEGLKRNLLKSDLDEKLIDEIAELGKQLIYGFDTDF